MITSTCVLLSHFAPAVQAATVQWPLVSLIFSGAPIGALSLSLGVLVEAAAVRYFAGPVLAQMHHESAEEAKAGVLSQHSLTLSEFWRFYAPLMLTALISLGLPPVVSAFVGGSYRAVESLAVLPIFYNLAFIFRCFSLSFQDPLLALTRRHKDYVKPLQEYSVILAAGTATALLALTWWPLLANFWFVTVCGLEPSLVQVIQEPVKLLPIYAIFSMLLSYFSAQAMLANYTKAITWSSVGEVGGAIIILIASRWIMKNAGDDPWLTGIGSAVFAIVTGRAIGAGVLWLSLRMGRG
jgi:hypothetical protein